MAQTELTSIIHKKARSGREDFDARAMSPSKALRLALAKSADSLLDLALSVLTVEQKEVSAKTVADTMGDDGLLILLDGADGQRGAVKFDTQLIAALIETQIIGEVRANEAPQREYTRTDAAMAAPFIDAVLAAFDARLLHEIEGYIPVAMRFGDRMEDARVLGLALEGSQYDLFRVTLDVAQGAKTGVVTLILPQRKTVVAKDEDAQSGDARSFASLEKNALEATATLDAVLARVSLPLRDICALKPGMTLPLPRDCLAEAELYAPRKHLVAEVRLGQMNGLRAVRISIEGDQGEALPGPGRDAASAAFNGPAQSVLPSSSEEEAAALVATLPETDIADFNPEHLVDASAGVGVAEADV